jgi:hypothetical protein
MFAGHLAVALAARPFSRRAPLGLLVAAAYGLDLLWPFLLFAGIERVRVDPSASAFTPLAFDHYPWSHSLSMAVIWSVAAGRITASVLRDAASGAIVGAVVLSHWLLDFVTHVPDLPLWPGGPTVGLGLWNSIPATYFVEGLLTCAAATVYWRTTRARRAVGKVALWGLLAFTIAIWAAGPMSPPPPGPTAVASVALALWLLPVWGAWIERNRDRKVTSAAPRSRW